MARRNRFVPAFDHLGLRITPSDASPAGPGPDTAETTTHDEGLGIPGEDSMISDSITFILPGLDEEQTEDPTEAILANVEWILPTD